MNAHPDATPRPRAGAAAAFPPPPNALFDAKHAPLPPPPPPPPSPPPLPPPPFARALPHTSQPSPLPPSHPPDSLSAPLASAAPPPRDKLHTAYVHRPVISHTPYLYPLHHQMMTPVAHVPIGAAHYAHLPPSIWPPPHQYSPQHLPHHSVVAHMQPSYALQHPPPVAYTYAPIHTAPLPSIKPPPAQDPYSQQSMPYHVQQHQVLHHPRLPVPLPHHHRHLNATATQSASLSLELTHGSIAPPIDAIHPPQQPITSVALASKPPNHPAATPPPPPPPPPKSKSIKDSSSASKAPSSSNSTNPPRKPRKPYTMTKTRELWSSEEHARFVQALKLYDRDWKKIETYIGTKTVLQIRSHAQKHFGKVTKYKTGEYIPPPRPKKRAALPYPRSRNTNTSKTAAPSSGTASESGNGSENGMAHAGVANGHSSEGFRPITNGMVRNTEPIIPHRSATATELSMPNGHKWDPNGYVVAADDKNANDAASVCKSQTITPRVDRFTAHIRNLVDSPQPVRSSAHASNSRMPSGFAAADKQPLSIPSGSKAYEPSGSFATCNDEKHMPNGADSTSEQQCDVSIPNNSLHVLSNCVDMMTRDALPRRQPAAGWASAAAARRAHRAKVVRTRKPSLPSSPTQEKDGNASLPVQNGIHGTAAVNGVLLSPGRKNDVTPNALSATTNNVVQKRGRSPPIVQTNEEREQVHRPDPQRSSANSSNGKSDVNGEFNRNDRPSASETGNGLSSGGSGTGNSPDNSESGLPDDVPRCSSNDGSADDGNRISPTKRDSSATEPISSNCSGNSPKRGPSISHLLSDANTTMAQSERSSEPSLHVSIRGRQNCSVEMDTSNGDMNNSQRCKATGAGVRQDARIPLNFQQKGGNAGAFSEMVYIATKEERVGVDMRKQGNEHHSNGVVHEAKHSVKQRERNGRVAYDGAPSIGAKRARIQAVVESGGRSIDEEEYGRERKTQRMQQVGKSIKTEHEGNQSMRRPTTHGPLRR